MKKTAYIICASALLLFAFLGCSDNNSSPQEKESAGATNDGHDVLVFNKGDLDEILFKIDTVYITDSTFLGRMFFRNLPASKTPEPGDIINSSTTKHTPYGFLYKVTEVAKEGSDVTIVSVTYASIAEAVEEADIEFEIPLIYEEEADANPQILAKSWWKKAVSVVKKVVNTVVTVVDTVFDALAGNWDVGGTKGETFSVNKTASFGNSKNGGDVRLNGSYALSLTTKIKLKNYSLSYAKMSIAQNKNLNLEGNLNGNISLKKDFDLASYRLPDVEFMVGPIIVYLYNTALIKAKVEAEVQANMNAKLIFNEFSEYGFEYDGSFKRINTCEKDFYYDYKYSAYGSVRFGALVGLSSMFYGVAGLELSAGPSLVLKSPMLPLSENSKTTIDRDLDIDMKVKLQFLEFLKMSYSFGSARISLGTLSSSKTLPSFSVKLSNFDLKGIAGGKLSFPFEIKKPELGFSIDEFGFCIEPKEGECVKGIGFGLGKLGKIAGSVVNFEGLATGTYNIIPYFKSLDGEIFYDMANAIMNFKIDSYCNNTVYDPKTQFCSLQEIKVYDLCGGKDYNTLTQFCYSQEVYNLCGGSSYNPTTHFCNSNKLYSLCGGSSYNPSTQFCFNKTAYPKCDGKNYDPSEGEMCCGAKIFNSKMQGCSNDSIIDKVDGFVNDEQGHRYGYVKIGEQHWLSENLNYNAPGSVCNLNNPVNCKIYGRLYNWATAMALPDSCNTKSCANIVGSPHKGICPDGWHIPTLAEWNKLILFTEGIDNPDSLELTKNLGIGRKLLAQTPLWNSFYYGGGPDEFGISILPGGYGSSDNVFTGVGGVCSFWGATEGGGVFHGTYGAREQQYDIDYYAKSKASYRASLESGNAKDNYLSIRCVKD